MPQSWLPYLPSKLLSETADWGFQNSVTSSMGSLLQQGQDLMRPVAEQVTDVVTRALPAPSPAPAPAPAPTPDIKPFALPSLESWGMTAPPEPTRAPQAPIDLTPAPRTPSTPAQGPSGGFLGAGGFSLPDPEAWGMVAPARSPTGGGSGVSPTSGAAAPRPAGPAPSDVNEYLRYAAGKAGIDPAQVLAVMGKEGPTGWGSVGTFDTGTSYGPLQLHYAGGSNPKEGMGDRFTRATGIDLRKDSSVQAHQAAVDFALGELAKRGDWSEWYGADNAFPAASGGQGRFTPVKRVQPTAEQSPPTSGAPRPGTYAMEALVPNQISEGQAQGLTAEEALAVCGPAAAVAFSRTVGRAPTLKEAKELASRLGVWDVGNGMHGPASEVKLLDNMGISAQMQEGTDWTRVAQEVQAGRPVIIDTPNHYFVASGFDPQTGEFEFGQSAGVLRASKGKTRYRPQDLPNLGMGSPRASIFLLGGK